VLVMNPLGVKKTSDARQPSRRLASLTGARLGLLSNRKPNADLLLELLAKELKRSYGTSVVAFVKKPNQTHPATADELAALTECTAVIHGVGD
jgi:hypothetical protein